jgi:uncharacterized protein (TIGR00255 family)
MQSMTGYSRLTFKLGKDATSVEIRSTNHRYLEVSQRLSDELAGFERQVSELVKSKLKRGRIEISVNIQRSDFRPKRLNIDEDLLKEYHKHLLGIKSRLHLKGDITFEKLLELPHVLSAGDEPEKKTDIWPQAKKAIEAALAELVNSRHAEGKRLLADIKSQAALIKKKVSLIRRRLPKSILEQKKHFQKKVKEALCGACSATSAQIQEAVSLIKETDINEELIRLESHLQNLSHALINDSSVGKKLDFIAQELTREANTIGAKANDAKIAGMVIDIKGAIEKIREQAQNLE